MENWKPVVGYEGLYEISDLGRFRSLVRHGGFGNRRYGGKVLSMKTSPDHYLSARLSKNNKAESKPAHIAVLEAFVGPKPNGYEACHNNGDKHDNRLENLRWDSRSGNFSDKKKHGTDNAGIKHYKAKFSEDQVRAIRKAGIPDGELAQQYMVSKTCIRQIRVGMRYANVQ